MALKEGGEVRLVIAGSPTLAKTFPPLEVTLTTFTLFSLSSCPPPVSLTWVLCLLKIKDKEAGLEMGGITQNYHDNLYEHLID
jgi:hypothetical protein